MSIASSIGSKRPYLVRGHWLSIDVVFKVVSGIMEIVIVRKNCSLAIGLIERRTGPKRKTLSVGNRVN